MSAPALARRQLEPPRDLRRQVAQRHAESAALRLGTVVALVVRCGASACVWFSASRSSCSTVTFSVFSCLSRSTFTGTVVPGLVADDHLHELVAVLAPGVPLNSMMTSPGSMPALRRGAFGRTDDTTAPLRDPSGRTPRALARHRRTLTPMRPRIILPSRSCGSSSRTVLIGTAKPMPMLPSDCRVADRWRC